MKPHEVASQFDTRPGYRIMQYGEVGIPVWALAISALAQEKRKFDPVAEFCLHAVSNGVSTVNEIAGLLGLEALLARTAVTSLIQDECVGADAAGTLFLTSRGRSAHSESSLRRPVEIRRTVLYDGWTRRPTFFPEHQLLVPRELRASAAHELRPFPQRPPEAHELDPMEVQDAIRLSLKRDMEDLVVLKVKAIERSTRFFVPAVAMVFKGENDARLLVEFAIDGRLSEIHAEAFARHDGIEKTNVFRDAIAPPEQVDLSSVFGKKFAKKIATTAEEKGKRSLAVARFKLSVAQSRVEEASSDNIREEAEQSQRMAQEGYDKALAAVATSPVRHLLTYEHPPLLEKAMTSATSRLIIVSPWIRRGVVNREFLITLRATLKRGVQVFIGYGLGEGDKGAKESDRDAENDLMAMAKEFARFKLRRFGDTHAKILVKDLDYCVVGSFNWLSFAGDPERTFREERSTLVSIPEAVRELTDSLIERFERRT